MDPIDMIQELERRAEEQSDDSKHQQLVELLTQINENLKKLQKPEKSGTIDLGENK